MVVLGPILRLAVRSHTTIPTFKVLAWNSNFENPIGAEYIIMEKASGVQLHKIWGDLSEFKRLKVIQNLTLLEKQLSSLQFPAFGSLYFRNFAPNHHVYRWQKTPTLLVPTVLDP